MINHRHILALATFLKIFLGWLLQFFSVLMKGFHILEYMYTISFSLQHFLFQII